MLIAVNSVLLGFTASNCIVFAEYVLFVRGGEASELEMKLLAAGLLTTIVMVHSCKQLKPFIPYIHDTDRRRSVSQVSSG